MTTTAPWEIHPDLTSERLVAVARLISRGRNDALDRFDPSVGDDGWTLGCRAYQFGRFRVLEAIDSGDAPWLTVLDRTKQFVFKIGKVPVRFYRGPADEPNHRTLRQSYPELQQLAFGFASDAEGRDLAFRFAVETDFDGAITSVKFLGLRGETPVLCWEIPLAASSIRLFPIALQPAEGVELPRPTVKVLGHDEDSNSGAA
jgi:hypothetical protein